MPFVYILKCADGSYYTGQTVDLERRLVDHRAGRYGGYTSTRLPVELVWHQEMPDENQAFELERRIKGWTRAKKEALIRGDFQELHEIVKRERHNKESR